MQDQWCVSMWSGCAGVGELRREASPAFARGLKLKRSRQRVDAGQPRNSYPPHRPPAAAPSSPPMSSTTPFASSPATTAPPPHFDPAAHAAAPFASLFNSSHMNAFYRLQQQALLSAAASDEAVKAAAPPAVAAAAVSDADASEGTTPAATASPPSAALGAESNGNDAKACGTCDETEAGEEEAVTAKRTRVEHIVSSIYSAPNSPGANADTSGSAEAKSESDEPRSLSATGSNGCETSPRSKRKSYQPQKELNGNTDSDHLADSSEADAEKKDEQPSMDRFQLIFEHQRRQYMEWLNSQQQKVKEGGAEATARTETEQSAEELRRRSSGSKENLTSLAESLKAELRSQLTATVDRILGEFMEKEAARVQAQVQAMRALEASRSQQASAARAANPYGSLFNQYYGAFGAYGAAFPHFAAATSSPANASIFPGGFSSAPGMTAPFPSAGEAGAAVAARREHPFNFFSSLNKRKRSKVTDTRISGRLSGLKEEGRAGSPNGYYPPTMVGHPLYGAALPGLDDLRDNDSPVYSDDMSFESGPVDPSIPQSTTLTPMHLRKAKLMFFYTRYPSSTLIKTYFPDIRFNKNTTAQLVKWFSNFREFYYIQMEKFARQALAEGIRRPEDIHISVDGDLYKTLNQHYNRNNHIQPPADFRDVVEATLREFFLSVQAGKDAESSWKKQIYKVIARLDSTIPDYFKNPHFLDQLD